MTGAIIHTHIIYVMLSLLSAQNGVVMGHLEYTSMDQCEKAISMVKLENQNVAAACVEATKP